MNGAYGQVSCLWIAAVGGSKRRSQQMQQMGLQRELHVMMGAQFMHHPVDCIVLRLPGTCEANLQKGVFINPTHAQGNDGDAGILGGSCGLHWAVLWLAVGDQHQHLLAPRAHCLQGGLRSGTVSALDVQTNTRRGRKEGEVHRQLKQPLSLSEHMQTLKSKL